MNMETLETLKELTKTTRKYTPDILDGNALAWKIASTMFEMKRCATILRVINSQHYQIRSIQKLHSNNWLKMHGYPMKRNH